MFQPNGSTIECGTCVAANTSACGECVVSYVLANDAGPIEYVPAPEPVDVCSRVDSSVHAAVGLFMGAGLVDDPVVFISVAEFQMGRLREPEEIVLVR